MVALLPAHHPYNGSWQQEAAGADRLTVQSGGLGVTLSQADTQQVAVVMNGSYTGHLPQVSVTRSGTEIVVTAGCSGDCSEHLQITVPTGLAAQVSAGDAAIEAKGLTGRLELTTGSAAIEVDRASGPLTLRSTAGAVSVTDSSSPTVEVATTDGAVTASFTAAPTSVKITTNDGGVEVKVPHEAAYHVDAQSSDSTPSVSLPNTDQNATHNLSVKTRSGGILVH